MFAEQYTTAVHTPTQYHEDLVDQPAARLDSNRAGLAAAQTSLAAATTDADRRRIQAQIDTFNTQITRGQASQASRQTQFNIMRNEVFHTDTAVTTAAGTLSTVATATGNAVARQQRIAQFQAVAPQAVTPAQVEQLRALAASDIGRL